MAKSRGALPRTVVYQRMCQGRCVNWAHASAWSCWQQTRSALRAAVPPPADLPSLGACFGLQCVQVVGGAPQWRFGIVVMRFNRRTAEVDSDTEGW